MRDLAASRWALPILLLAAAALRLGTAWGASIHHPDEVFQYLEPAHRLVFGYGYFPWEYREGIRGWHLPLLLAGPMAIGGAIAPDGTAHVLLPRLAVALATLGVVWGAWAIGARVARGHALAAGLLAAIWYEQVYFAGHTLSETIATAAAIPGIALLAAPGRRARAAAGALIAFAALARFHYAPALAIVVLWQARTDWRQWRDLALGAAPLAIAAGATDLAMGASPFAWIWANFHRNVIGGVAATFGVSGPMQYLVDMRQAWGAALLPFAFLAFVGARRRPDLLLAALATIALHTMIGHKEYRFILLATTLLLILAGLGTAEVAAQLRPAWRGRALGVALSGWAALSLALALSFPLRLQWSSEAPALSAAVAAGRGGLCGLATWRLRFWQPGGYTYLHRRVPIYPVSARDELGYPPATAATLADLSPSYDALLTTMEGMAEVPPGFRLVTCKAPPATIAAPADRAARAVCLYRRAGGCDPALAEPWRLSGERPGDPAPR